MRDRSLGQHAADARTRPGQDASAGTRKQEDRQGAEPRSAVTGAQLLLLIGLIADAQLDRQELDQFPAGARRFADQLMS
jgi:hypothetical protein